jgi:hypothetical protein
MPRLSKLEAVEVSLVPRGANRKKFLLTKSADEVPMNEEILKSLLEADLKDEDKLNTILKKNMVPEEAYDPIKAAIRLLNSVKDKIPSGSGAEIISTLSQWVGIEPPKPGVIEPTNKDCGEDKDKMMKGDNQNKGDKMPNDELLKSLPEETRTKVEALFKANDDKVAEAVKKAEEAEKALKAERDEKIKKEFIEKAATLKKVPAKAERLGEILKAFSEVNKEMTDELFGVLKAADEAIEKGGLFDEKGSTAINKGEKAMEKIEKAATALAAEKKITKAQAMDQFLMTEEGKNLYNEYESERS